MEKKIEKNVRKKNLVGSANPFQLGSSIEKHAGSRGAAPQGSAWGRTFVIFLQKKMVLKSSETYAQKIFLNSEKKNEIKNYDNIF